MSDFERRPPTAFSEQAQANVAEIKEKETNVLIGRNNSGKSYILKMLTSQIGEDAAYLGPARYTNFDRLPMFQPKNNTKEQRFQKFREWRRQTVNMDNSPFNLQQTIASFDNAKRAKLFKMLKELLDIDIEIKKVVPNNDMSQSYLSCEGHNFSYTSSGVRLITSILVSLLDEDFHTFLIDEPELGISPEAQGLLAEFLFDSKQRKKYLSHVKTIVLATHSTIFIDRKHIRNNYFVSKESSYIDIKRIETQVEFNHVHFFLLGNRLETLFLPTLIFVVEGISEEIIFKRFLACKYPSHAFSVYQARDDSRVAEAIHIVASFFGDLQRGPYRDRIIPVLDSVHSPGLPDKLERAGLKKDNVVIWSKNGIEYLYPESIMNDIFGSGGELQVFDQDVCRNAICFKKRELAEEVASRLRPETEFPKEWNDKIVNKIDYFTKSF